MDYAWDEYKRRRRAFRLALLLAPLWLGPGAVIRYFLISYGLDVDVAFFLAVVLPPMLAIVVTHIRRTFWPCARCGHPFHVSWLYGNPFSRRCVHCRLPLWADPSGPNVREPERATH
jgi:hypothetical protein